MLTEWTPDGVLRWSKGSNLGQKARRETKMQKHAYIHTFIPFVSSFGFSASLLMFVSCIYSIEGKVHS